MIKLKIIFGNLSLCGIFCLGLLLFSPVSLLSQTVSNRYIPKQEPDRIVLTVTQDPATSMAVTWRTDTSMSKSFAEILPADPNPLSVKNASELTAHTEILVSPEGRYKDLTWKEVTANYHSIVFKNLQPGTLYNYRVGNGQYLSEWFQFRTASQSNSELTFIYFSDAQTGLRSMMWSKVVRQAYAQAPNAQVMLHAGDLVNRANRDEEWGEWFEAGSFIMAMVPNMPSPGNHDYGRGKTAMELSSFWRPQFTLPENGPEGLEETCYYTDIQGVRFISLDSYMVEESDEYLKKQKEWLDRVLHNNPNKWTCIVFHHPIFSLRVAVIINGCGKTSNPYSINIKRIWYYRHMIILMPEACRKYQ